MWGAQPQNEIADICIGITRQLQYASQAGIGRFIMPLGKQRLRSLGLQTDGTHHLRQAIVQIAADAIALIQSCQGALLFNQLRLGGLANTHLIFQARIG